jgi:hypothetical protein
MHAGDTTMAELQIHHIKVVAHTKQGEEVELYMGMPGHPTLEEILEVVAGYHGFATVDEMCHEWR